MALTVLPVTLGYPTIVLRPSTLNELCAAVEGKQCFHFLKTCDQAGVKLRSKKNEVELTSTSA
jgi:hypothetical protein